MTLEHFSASPFTSLTNSQLHQQTLSAAETERTSTLEVLRHLRENEKRMLYAGMGYKDLKEYCVKELKISEGSAWRRISAMRLLREIPQIETQLKSGTLNLSQIAMARTHFKETKSSLEKKKEILSSLENQSIRMTERILAEEKPEDIIVRPAALERALRGQCLEVTLVLDEALQNELNEIQILLGKEYSKLDLFKLLAKEKLVVLKKDLFRRTKTNLKNNISKDSKTRNSMKKRDDLLIHARDAQPAPNSRYINKGVKREVKIRDQHQCRFVDPATKRRCSSKFHLQFDHINPFSLGGENTVENLRTLCSAHNRLQAVRVFGTGKMKEFVPSLT